MGRPRDPFLALVEDAVTTHQPASEALDALRDMLDDLADQIKVLQEMRERAAENYSRARVKLEKVADGLYAKLAELAEQQPQYLEELLSAIVLVMLHLEGAEPDVTSTILASGYQLLMTPSGSSVVYLQNDEWHGCQTTAAPRLAWDGDQWWLRLGSDLPALHVALDTLSDAQRSAIGRTVFIGREDIRALVRRLADEGSSVRPPDSLVEAVRDAGLPPEVLEPFIQ
jgi:hypothetical protein